MILRFAQVKEHVATRSRLRPRLTEQPTGLLQSADLLLQILEFNKVLTRVLLGWQHDADPYRGMSRKMRYRVEEIR